MATIVMSLRASYSSLLIRHVRDARSTIELRASDIGPNLIQEIKRAADRGVRVSLALAKEPAILKGKKNILLKWPDTWDFFPLFDSVVGNPFTNQNVSYHSGTVIDGTTMIVGMNQDITNEKEDLEITITSFGGMSIFQRQATWTIH